MEIPADARVNPRPGVLATKGGVVFVAAAEGQLIALDAKTGKPLWHFRTSGPISASPIGYAVDGKQYRRHRGGNVVYSFALPEQKIAGDFIAINSLLPRRPAGNAVTHLDGCGRGAESCGRKLQGPQNRLGGCRRGRRRSVSHPGRQVDAD